MGVTLWLLVGPDAFWHHGSDWARAGRLAGLVVAGAAVYFAALWLLGFRLRDFQKRTAA